MRKICRLHVLIRIQPDQYQARPIRGQDLGGVPAPGIIGVTRPRFFAEARRVFCLCCTSPFVGYSPRFPLSPTIILRIFSRWVIGPHYDVSETWPSRLHRRPQLRTTLARRRRRGTQDPQPPGRRSAQRPRLVPGTGPLSQLYFTTSVESGQNMRTRLSLCNFDAHRDISIKFIAILIIWCDNPLNEVHIISHGNNWHFSDSN